MDGRSVSDEVAALLGLMSRRGVAILWDRGGYRLGAFSTRGPGVESLPGVLGRLGLKQLDLPKAPSVEIIAAMLHAGLIAPAFEPKDQTLGVYVLTADGLRRTLAAQHGAACDFIIKPTGPARLPRDRYTE